MICILFSNDAESMHATVPNLGPADAGTTTPDRDTPLSTI